MPCPKDVDIYYYKSVGLYATLQMKVLGKPCKQM